MMSDIVQRLNADADRWMSGDMVRDNEDAGTLSHEAAEEILRLSSRLGTAVDILEKWAASPYKGPTLETKNFLRGEERVRRG